MIGVSPTCALFVFFLFLSTTPSMVFGCKTILLELSMYIKAVAGLARTRSKKEILIQLSAFDHLHVSCAVPEGSSICLTKHSQKPLQLSLFCTITATTCVHARAENLGNPPRERRKPSSGPIESVRRVCMHKICCSTSVMRCQSPSKKLFNCVPIFSSRWKSMVCLLRLGKFVWVGTLSPIWHFFTNWEGIYTLPLRMAI